MPFDSIISRPDAEVFIPEDLATEVIKAAAGQSVALARFRRVSMGTQLTKVPVLSALPVAYFVNGDTGLKQTADMAWTGKTLTAEEIAAIVPVPEAVIDDAGFPLWDEVREALVEAVAHTLDAAVFAGTNKPASWPTAIVPAAVAAANTVEIGTATAEEGGVVGDIDAAMEAVEAGGYEPNGIAALRTLRALLRRARDVNGQRLTDPAGASVEGLSVNYAMAGIFPANTVAVVGDFTQAILGLRQDIRYKLLDQAVMTDDSGAVIFNLPQQDMVALRVTMRVAFQVANPISREATDATPYPFATLTDAA